MALVEDLVTPGAKPVRLRKAFRLMVAGDVGGRLAVGSDDDVTMRATSQDKNDRQGNEQQPALHDDPTTVTLCGARTPR